MAKSTAKPSRRRGDREGSIYPYRGGYRGAVTWTDAEGKRHRRTVSGKLREDVRQKVTALTAGLDRGVKPPENTTVGAYLVAWLEAIRQSIRPST